jgi:putative restriction endonuclease
LIGALHVAGQTLVKLRHSEKPLEARFTRPVMSRESVLDQFDQLAVWSRGDQRAPHKPLLVLYALGRWTRGDRSDIPFRDVAPVLTELLKEFGPPRKSYHPEYPFWRLQNDGVWAVHTDGELLKRKGHTDPRKSELLAHDARAGFTDEVKEELDEDSALLAVIASRLLDRHFPESIHPDILSAVGLVLTHETAAGPKRDPQFRQKVLTAYGWRCAVCGFDVRLGSVSIALDAAHIRWHQAGGPAREDNGLALCVLHHKTFDLGAFTLNEDGVLLVSEQANGSTGLEEALLRYHGVQVRPPQRPEYRPAPEHLDWHAREVFRRPARHVEADTLG